MVDSQQHICECVDIFRVPYRIGDRVKVCEKDEDISGVIIDITMFHLLLRHESGNIITTPILLLQKGVIKVIAPSSPSPLDT